MKDLLHWTKSVCLVLFPVVFNSTQAVRVWIGDLDYCDTADPGSVTARLCVLFMMVGLLTFIVRTSNAPFTTETGRLKWKGRVSPTIFFLFLLCIINVAGNVLEMVKICKTSFWIANDVLEACISMLNFLAICCLNVTRIDNNNDFFNDWWVPINLSSMLYNVSMILFDIANTNTADCNLLPIYILTVSLSVSYRWQLVVLQLTKIWNSWFGQNYLILGAVEEIPNYNADGVPDPANTPLLQR